ncbi:hypothetical protein ACFU53_15080 [Streptomyces sp. NPDC057474]|uniref:hypothetical protein n=1 Tax=Streptomyces sp. NPDC057474 TaxID=3346144 RepID=UPI0036AC388F
MGVGQVWSSNCIQEARYRPFRVQRSGAKPVDPAVRVTEFILEYRSLFEAPKLYATIVVILVEALALIAAARWAERRATPWAAPRKAARSTRD